MMDTCKESKLRAQCEEERNVARQKIVLLEKEAKEHQAYRTALEDHCKKLEDSQGALKAASEEQVKTVKELKITCEKHLATVADLKKEIEAEKKLAEEWKTQCAKNEVQKGMSDQVEVLTFLLGHTELKKKYG